MSIGSEKEQSPICESHRWLLRTNDQNKAIAPNRKLADSETDWRTSSDPVPGRESHPLESSAFHGALFLQLQIIRW
jgi:hypothetical protein